MYYEITEESLKLKCNDTDLESLIHDVVSNYTNFVNVKDIEGYLINVFEQKDLFEKRANTIYKSITLTPFDQFRINKILCQMIMNGQLIINLIGRKYYSGNGFEVAWAGEKTT